MGQAGTGVEGAAAAMCQERGLSSLFLPKS
jgi:hypothetical protein